MRLLGYDNVLARFDFDSEIAKESFSNWFLASNLLHNRSIKDENAYSLITWFTQEHPAVRKEIHPKGERLNLFAEHHYALGLGDIGRAAGATRRFGGKIGRRLGPYAWILGFVDIAILAFAFLLPAQQQTEGKTQPVIVYANNRAEAERILKTELGYDVQFQYKGVRNNPNKGG